MTLRGPVTPSYFRNMKKEFEEKYSARPEDYTLPGEEEQEVSDFLSRLEEITEKQIDNLAYEMEESADHIRDKVKFMKTKLRAIM